MMQPIKPVIGITSSIVNHDGIPSVNLHEKYIRSVTKAGGIPIVIPTGTEDMPEVWTSICNGIILSSGEDIDPHSYQANPEPRIQKTNEKRDLIEMGLVKNALNQKKPIFAICRGITMQNVALGGTVIQDIETNNPNAIKHFQQAARPNPTHEIQIGDDSQLFQILKSSTFRVNSMHHQAIDKLAPGLKIVAVAPDGIIEAVEGVDKSSLWLAIQWHPEEMASEDPAMQGLFKAFIDKCTLAKEKSF
ncbi:gamma-glutamyl-gamma-aminobutyrate hydrolase family protein [Virgibacillus necropolis]|uniref:Gamma-glutamyl-gamma-aminobutyrate hydrolase n=1 Tax=Virgibacillus necropolis TaxID=163877 RepID=A0A221MCP3_9BACI|nr:gamma-glutamyl-gamma-aminobutyrate hydrolase family protein [Virgibacillus necropolis]ASN05397.1 gamma-glutamyl-gamma-aminobutyrate hydrolase [Virgibacillus necropolis]